MPARGLSTLFASAFLAAGLQAQPTRLLRQPTASAEYVAWGSICATPSATCGARRCARLRS